MFIARVVARRASPYSPRSRRTCPRRVITFCAGWPLKVAAELPTWSDRALLNQFLIVLTDEDALHVDARQVNPDLDLSCAVRQTLDLGDSDTRRHGDDRVKVTGSLAEPQERSDRLQALTSAEIAGQRRLKM